MIFYCITNSSIIRTLLYSVHPCTGVLLTVFEFEFESESRSYFYPLVLLNTSLNLLFLSEIVQKIIFILMLNTNCFIS